MRVKAREIESAFEVVISYPCSGRITQVAKVAIIYPITTFVKDSKRDMLLLCDLILADIILQRLSFPLTQRKFVESLRGQQSFR